MLTATGSADSFVRVVWRVSLVAVALLAGSVASQVVAQNAAQDPRGGELSPGCLPRATRLREHCDPVTVVVRSESETEVSLALPVPETVHCAATIAIEYTQRDTVVAITGTIETADCAACSGDYEVTVSVRDPDAGLKTRKFVESWQRQDDQPVAFRLEYPIGQNVDLTNVRARQLRCTCVAADQK